MAILSSEKVEFLLVGGCALAYHGAPRFTEDIDILARVSEANAAKLENVLGQFGFEGLGLTQKDFLERDQVFQLGRAPYRIALLTGLSGVTWEQAWRSRKSIQLDGLELDVIGGKR